MRLSFDLLALGAGVQPAKLSCTILRLRSVPASLLFTNGNTHQFYRIWLDLVGTFTAALSEIRVYHTDPNAPPVSSGPSGWVQTEGTYVASVPGWGGYHGFNPDVTAVLTDRQTSSEHGVGGYAGGNPAVRRSVGPSPSTSGPTIQSTSPRCDCTGPGPGAASLQPCKARTTPQPHLVSAGATTRSLAVTSTATIASTSIRSPDSTRVQRGRFLPRSDVILSLSQASRPDWPLAARPCHLALRFTFRFRPGR